jgi:hypothetical protein
MNFKEICVLHFKEGSNVSGDFEKKHFDECDFKYFCCHFFLGDVLFVVCFDVFRYQS